MGYSELWSHRIQHEAKCWDSSLFVTLTYADDKLPEFGNLEYSHIQQFMRDLRRRYNGDKSIPETAGSRRPKPIRFFCAGEYGTQTARCHWHLLLFNLRLPDYWQAGPPGIELRSMHELWPHGNHRVEGFTPGRAAYIAGYATKKARGREGRRQYEVVNLKTGELFERRREFCKMSLKPGIGVYYFRRHRADFERGYMVREGGIKARLPRLYAEYLKEEVPGFAEKMEARRLEYLASLDPDEQTDDRLRAREDVHKARVGLHGKERQF